MIENVIEYMYKPLKDWLKKKAAAYWSIHQLNGKNPKKANASGDNSLNTLAHKKALPKLFQEYKERLWSPFEPLA